MFRECPATGCSLSTAALRMVPSRRAAATAGSEQGLERLNRAARMHDVVRNKTGIGLSIEAWAAKSCSTSPCRFSYLVLLNDFRMAVAQPAGVRMFGFRTCILALVP